MGAPVLSASAGPPGLSKRARPRRIIAVGGGKGGIGKTLVSANLGIALAQAGMRVLLVDADLGGANLHTCLGVGQPSATLSDFVRSSKTRIEDIILPTGVPHLSLIAGAQDVLDAANIKYAQKQKLLRSLTALPVDYLLLDLGAGTSFNTLDFFLVADHGVLVVLPEPTAVENAYRFVKAAFFRKLQQVEAQYGIEDLVESALTTREGNLRTPHDFIAQVRKDDPAAGARLEKDLMSFRIRLVVNQARTDADMTVGNAVVSAWKKFFGLEMDDLGAIRYDDEAWRAIRKRRPVLLERPESPAAQGLQRIAGRILALDGTAFPTSSTP
ncbi:P-loop NTPase [Stigmatella erecta]|uniref:Flagellar biosynthesis protein FlhG n=1 Tax=Stigmatella erecta TaxID=83460 RepID=A0A1I0B633_9BACT|nr:P-loop NTPase [Stigmatella erecta]SET01867.1 flagellar biosynthesis protein FlhG [Stigmatella erecta]